LTTARGAKALKRAGEIIALKWRLRIWPLTEAVRSRGNTQFLKRRIKQAQAVVLQYLMYEQTSQSQKKLYRFFTKLYRFSSFVDWLTAKYAKFTKEVGA